MATKKNAVPTAVPGSVPSNTGTGAGSASTSTGEATPPPLSKTPNGFESSLQQMLAGFQNYVPTGFVLPSSSGGFSQAAVVAQLQSMLALYPQVTSAKQAASQAVANLRAQVPSAHALMVALKAALVGYFGHGNPALAQFGIVEKKAAQPSALQNAVKAAKAKQTRINNGTLGKRQKAAQQLQKEVAQTLTPQVAAPQKQS